MADREQMSRGRIAWIGLVAAILSGCAAGSRSGTLAPTEYAFWPPAPDEPRIQFLRTYAVSSDVERRQSAFDRIVFGAQSTVLPIAKPYGVEMWNGRIYVCDITNPAVVILDLPKQEARLMVTRGVEQMTQPTDVAIAPDGMKYVADRVLGRIFVFDADDRHVTTLGDKDLVPAGVAVDGDELYVADFQTQSVQVLDRRTGARLRSIGGPDMFVRPLGVTVDREGNVYVGDAIRGQLRKFDAQGNLLLSLGQIGDTPGSFVRPKHVAVDGDGVIYVVDAAFQNVQMFNADGELLMFFGGSGGFPGSMSLPAGITVHEGDLEAFADLIHPAFDARRLLLVTNQFGRNKVSVYAVGGLRPGATMDDISPYAAQLSPVPESADGDSGS